MLHTHTHDNGAITKKETLLRSRMQALALGLSEARAPDRGALKPMLSSFVRSMTRGTSLRGSTVPSGNVVAGRALVHERVEVGLRAVGDLGEVVGVASLSFATPACKHFACK